MQQNRTQHPGWPLALAASLVFLGASALTGQTRVSGVVVEDLTRRPVPGARVQVLDRDIRTATDSGGRFVLSSLPPGRYTFRLTRIGFEPLELPIAVADTAVELEVTMKPLALRLSEVVITPSHYGVLEAEVVTEQKVTRDQIEVTPQVGEDVFRALKRLPGVASGDISTRLNVRGSTDQQLLVQLDGLELYEPYHLKDFDGALGVLDIHAVGGIELLTGGFPVEYGDKLAGVFKMKSRTPPASGTRTTLGLSITNASAMSQGGFAGGRGQWLASARRGYLDIVMSLTGGNENLSPRYWDAFGKLQYDLHERHRLTANVLYASDDLRLHEEEDDADLVTSWKSGYAWLTWDAYPSSRISARTIGWVGRLSRFRNGELEDTGGNDTGLEYLNVDDRRSFRFTGVKHDLTFDVSDWAMLKLGGSAQRMAADYDYTNMTRSIFVSPTGELASEYDTTNVDMEPSGREYGAYLAARLRPLRPLTAEVGVRYDYISHTDEGDFAPRLLAAYDLTRQTALRASWGRYRQSHGVHELEVGDGEYRYFNSDLAEQVAIGIDQKLMDGVSLRIEAYRRIAQDPRPRYVNATRELQAFPEAEGDRMLIDPTRGRAMGVELLLSRELGSHWAWSASYAYSRAEDEVEGRWVPRNFDQEHAVGFTAVFRPGGSWNFAGGWYFHTGWPATQISYTTDTTATGDVMFTRVYHELNGIRLPNYHRLDLRVTRSFALAGGELHVYVDLFNIYGRTNLRSYTFGAALQDDGRILVSRYNGDELLPFLPSIGFRYHF